MKIRRFGNDDDVDSDEFRGVTSVSFEIESARSQVKVFIECLTIMPNPTPIDG